MLETRNLVKIYKPKKGVPVTALNGISLKFPDKGMVFLLGKSGSGKSTLLNVLGGLDRYDSGEILIKGMSSKDFRQRHFDSYRNTYVGFIFQEYNVLDEFSVGANIALALQLQGIKPTSERINEILTEVDLAGYGTRKPNELSGGQKQRVAIARALVKNPRIIMADEPTGALDSATGRQILSTLKKLSSDKLVIVVSHDREFAEQYADRIIELADGSVIRDVERVSEALPEISEPVYEEDGVCLPRDYVLTEEDNRAICRYIQKMVTEGKAPRFSLGGGEQNRSFQPTDPAKIQTSADGYHLIKSKLPMQYAFKMGASGLKHKKFRLVMTILLSCVAFVMFGLADTMASYDYVTTSVSSLADPNSQITYAAFEKEIGHSYSGGDDWYFDYDRLTDADFDLIREKTGLTAYSVYSRNGGWQSGVYLDMDFFSAIPPAVDEKAEHRLKSGYYSTSFGGYVEVSDTLLKDLGAELVAGRLPAAGTDELAISTFVLETFREFGHLDTRGYLADPTKESFQDHTTNINSAEDMLGKKLTLDGIEYTVTGVVDTGIDYSRYASLKEPLSEKAEFTDELLRMALQQELRYALNYSLTGLAMVGPGQFQRIYEKVSEEQDYDAFVLRAEGSDVWRSFEGCTFRGLSQQDSSKVVWLDGTVRTALQGDEIVVDEFVLHTYLSDNNLSAEALNFRLQYESDTPDFSAIAGLRFTLDINSYYQSKSMPVRIVGVIPNDYMVPIQTVIISDSVMTDAYQHNGPMICQTIAVMPKGTAAIRRLAEFSDTDFTLSDGTPYHFNLMNPVSFELKALDEIFEMLQKVFISVGVVFVVFASLLFSNFIATSISYKKREIGILRAIGSRSNDVFRIFFAESFLIAMMNFVLSLGGTFAICGLINYLVRTEAGLLLTVLTVGLRQAGLLFGICLLVAAAASFLPVRRIAAKRPIDAIRDR